MSTGPTTAAGKAASSQNGTTHGLTARHVVIKGEDPVEFEQFRSDMLAHYKPDGPVEAHFANEVIDNAWRLRRAHRIETETFDRHLESGEGLATAFHEHAKEFDRVRRYLTSIERTFNRALRELTQLQEKRFRYEQDQAMAEAVEDNAAVEPEEFVSQNPEEPLARDGRKSENRPIERRAAA